MGSLFGGKTQRETRLDNQFESQFQPLIKQNTEASQTALGKAVPLLDQSSDVLSGPLGYLKALFSGDRTKTTQALGPQLDTVSQRDHAALQNVSQFAPRGTGTSSRLNELSQGTASDINRLFLSMKPEAADKLTSLAQLLFGEGSTLFNAATGTAGNTLGDLLQNRGLNQQERNLRNQANQNIFKLAQGVFTGNFGV